VALVLETLGRNQSLDLRSLGVWLLALALGLDFTTDNKFADLKTIQQHFVSGLLLFVLTLCTFSLGGKKDRR
jgi:uncharacterized membrane protein YhhN